MYAGVTLGFTSLPTETSVPANAGASVPDLPWVYSSGATALAPPRTITSPACQTSVAFVAVAPSASISLAPAPIHGVLFMMHSLDQ